MGPALDLSLLKIVTAFMYDEELLTDSEHKIL